MKMQSSEVKLFSKIAPNLPVMSVLPQNLPFKLSRYIIILEEQHYKPLPSGLLFSTYIIWFTHSLTHSTSSCRMGISNPIVQVKKLSFKQVVCFAYVGPHVMWQSWNQNSGVFALNPNLFSLYYEEERVFLCERPDGVLCGLFRRMLVCRIAPGSSWRMREVISTSLQHLQCYCHCHWAI